MGPLSLSLIMDPRGGRPDLWSALLRRYDVSGSPLWARGPGAVAVRRDLLALARGRRVAGASRGAGAMPSPGEFAGMDGARDDVLDGDPLDGDPDEIFDGTDVAAHAVEQPGDVARRPGLQPLTLLSPPLTPPTRPLPAMTAAADTVLSPLSAALVSATRDYSTTDAVGPGAAPPDVWRRLLFGHERWEPAFMAGGGLPLAVTRELPQERAASDDDAPVSDGEPDQSDLPDWADRADRVDRTDQRDPYDGRSVTATSAPITMLPRLLELVASIQRKEETGGGSPGAPGLRRRALAVQQVARSGGQTLDHGIRRAMERTLGADLSGVRVHTDADAAGAASTLSAQAFTLGSSIYFAQGAFEPASPAGLALLGHELVHTVQQQSGVQRRAGVSPAGPLADDSVAEPSHLEDQALRAEATLLRLFTTTPPTIFAAPDEAPPPSLLRAYDGTMAGPAAAGTPDWYGGPPEPRRPSSGESPSPRRQSILTHRPMEGRADASAGADEAPREVARQQAGAGSPIAAAMAYAPRDSAAPSPAGASSATGWDGEMRAVGGGLVERAVEPAADIASFVRRAYAVPVIDVSVSVAAPPLPMALPMTARLDRVLPAAEVAPTAPTAPAGMTMGQAAEVMPPEALPGAVAGASMHAGGAIVHRRVETEGSDPAAAFAGAVAASASPVISAGGPGLGDTIARRVMDMPQLLANSATLERAPYTAGAATLARRLGHTVVHVTEPPDGGPSRIAARHMGQPSGDTDLSRAEPTPSPSMMRRVADVSTSTGLPDSLSIPTPPAAAVPAASDVGAFVHRFSDDVARRSGAPTGVFVGAMDGLAGGLRRGAAETMSLVRRFTDAVLSAGATGDSPRDGELAPPFTRDSAPVSASVGYPAGGAAADAPAARAAHLQRAVSRDSADGADGVGGADGAAYTAPVRTEGHDTVASMQRAMSNPTSPDPAHDYAAVPGGAMASGIGGALGALLPAIEARGAAMSNVGAFSHGGTGATSGTGGTGATGGTGVGAVVRRLTSFFHADDPTATGPLARSGHPGDVLSPAAGPLSSGLMRRMGALPVDEPSWATTLSPQTGGAVARTGSGLDAMRTDRAVAGDSATDASPGAGAIARAFAGGPVSPGFDAGEGGLGDRAPADAGGSGFIGMGIGRVDRASGAADGAAGLLYNPRPATTARPALLGMAGMAGALGGGLMQRALVAAHGRAAPSEPSGESGPVRREESLADVLVRRATDAETTPDETVQALQGGAGHLQESAPLSYQGGIAAARRELDVAPDHGAGGEQDRGEALTLMHGIHVVDGRASPLGSAHDTAPVTFTASPDATGMAISNGSHGATAAASPHETTVTAPSGSATPAGDHADHADHGMPDVEDMVTQVLSRVKRQLILDHERAGGFLPDLLR